MDANKVLAEIRTLASKVSGQVEEVRRAGMAAPVYNDLADLAMNLASRVWLLDGHLTAGGTPPEVWREGPDAVGTETGPDAVGDERALPCRECGAMYGHNYPCDSVPEGPDVVGEDKPRVGPSPEAVRKAVAQLQAELTRNAEAIGRILSEDDNG